jgi:hypothetical protein
MRREIQLGVRGPVGAGEQPRAEVLDEWDLDREGAR